MKKHLEKIIAIVGPTASGKSDLAIALAQKYDGEVISADSRQVYRGMDIGTGKVEKDLSVSNTQYLTPREKTKSQEIYFSEGVIHYLLDVASPKRTYNVTHFIRDAKKSLDQIRKRGKIPIICGGTGFWVQSLIEENNFPLVKPNRELRNKLRTLSAETLFLMLSKKDPRRAKMIDAKNTLRLIRALEICEALGTVPTLQKSQTDYKNFSIIALCPPQEILHKNIAVRLERRLAQGMIAEIETLRANGLSWKRLESFGLEYRYVALFLQKKITLEEMKERLNFEIRHYAKRQLTWLKRWERMGAPIHFIADSKEALENY